ncbi:hypothetical protein H5410_009816 [Solanum commersonii]|uniref:Uncharacterized protein n=1 Tax=Solanum commersonii TaxID=4109 RepID=A0A9J6AJ01_SOLCO|nr:hypothetical protein H5410_009816 [Solanum commersonii]
MVGEKGKEMVETDLDQGEIINSARGKRLSKRIWGRIRSLVRKLEILQEKKRGNHQFKGKNKSMIDKVLFWNIRSVKSQNYFKRVIDLNIRHHYSYIVKVLQNWRSIEESWGYKMLSLATQQKSGFFGQITGKKKGTQDRFVVTVVYVRCSAIERLELWEDMEDMAMQNIPGMIQRSVGYYQCHKWKLRILFSVSTLRLDRVFGNNTFMNLLPKSEVHHLIRQGSDHAPLHVVYHSEQDPIIRPFKFLNFWTNHADFKRVVKKS